MNKQSQRTLKDIAGAIEGTVVVGSLPYKDDWFATAHSSEMGTIEVEGSTPDAAIRGLADEVRSTIQAKLSRLNQESHAAEMAMSRLASIEATGS